MKNKTLFAIIISVVLLIVAVSATFVVAADQDDSADTYADETTSAAEDEAVPEGDLSDVSLFGAVSFTNVAPLMQFDNSTELTPDFGLFSLQSGYSVMSTSDTGWTPSNAVTLDKRVTVNDDDYTITLEAYATGSKIVSSVTKDVPTDIVLVIDQSGSMDYCITCGEKITNNQRQHSVYTYTATTDVKENDNRTTYYIKSGDSYVAVKYCSGYHLDCNGAGWYRASDSHTASAKITPKTSSNSNGTQFYTRKEAGKEDCTSRLSALKTAVTTFVNSVNAKAKGADGKYGTSDDINHRIAIVGFGSDDTGNTPYQNTELFIGSNVYNYNGRTVDAKYSTAFQSMNTAAGADNVTDSVNNLKAGGGTAINLGAEMANNIFGAYAKEDGNSERAKVVVFFTDGLPGIKESATDSTRTGYANKAISQAYTSKHTYKASVYTVGVFAGADASTPNSLTTSTDWDENAVANKFMHLLSSNYYDAKAMDNTGSINPDLGENSYYLSAGDSTSLNNIFQQIADQIESGGSSTTLGAETVIRDIISPQFTLPDGATADDITIETYACTGVDANGKYTWVNNNSTMGASVTIGSTDSTDATTTNNQINITGFDFSENYVGTVTTNGTTVDYHGNKIVISFKIEKRDGFLGGNNVYTNGSESGIYENANATEPVAKFPMPEVNVAIDSTMALTPGELNVYLLGNVTLQQIKDGCTAKCGDVELKLGEANFGLEAWQYEYVNISVEITDKDGNTFSDLNNMKDDVTYSITVTVAPKTNGEGAVGTPATAQTETATDTINVFKPVLTFKDSTAYYGDTAPSNFAENLTNTVWMHGEKKSDDVTMTGSKPTLDLTYAPEAGKINDGKINTKKDIEVDVTVKIGSADVTANTTFKHTDCAGKTCGTPENGKFWIHVKTCQLTVTKKGGSSDESYVFIVLKDGEKYTELTVGADSSVTIYELPVGTYSIVEDTAWSWRYTAAYGEEATLTSSTDSGEVVCTNTLEKKYWLNGYSSVVVNRLGSSTK